MQDSGKIIYFLRGYRQCEKFSIALPSFPNFLFYSLLSLRSVLPLSLGKREGANPFLLVRLRPRRALFTCYTLFTRDLRVARIIVFAQRQRTETIPISGLIDRVPKLRPLQKYVYGSRNVVS
mgnify:CR=1 FL=1